MEFIQSILKFGNIRIRIKTYILLFVLFASGIFLSILYNISSKTFEYNLISQSKDILKQRNEIFQDFLEEEYRSIIYLYSSYEFKQFINSPTSTNRKSLKNKIIEYTTAHPNIYQFRVIDEKGMEVIRIEREVTNGKVFSNPELQDKKDSLYYSKSIERQSSIPWFTPIEPNREHGKIQVPVLETMRLVKPVYLYGEKEEFKGIIVLNYFIDDVLSKLSTIPFYDIYLFDNEGCILFFSGKETVNCHTNSKYMISNIFPDYHEKIMEDKSVFESNIMYLEDNSLIKDFYISGGLNLLLTPKKNFYADEKNELLSDLMKSYLVFISMIGFVFLFAFRYVDKITKDLNYVSKLNEDLRILNQHIEDSSRRDSLTNCYNRKYYNEVIQQKIKYFRNNNGTNSNICFFLIDIDNFKFINDEYGHDVGDQVIKDVVRNMQKCIRQNDLIFRVGGEEFALIVDMNDSFTNKNFCKEKSEEILKTIRQYVFYGENQDPVTVSIGTTKIYEGDDPSSIFKRADLNLYKSKRSGKNKVTSDESF